jgi:hypothetical protein
MEESGVVVEINARTRWELDRGNNSLLPSQDNVCFRVATDLLNFDFSNTEISCKVILQAEQLKEVLSDLDLSSDFVDLLVTTPEEGKGVLRISTDGVSGRLDIEIPKARTWKVSSSIESELCVVSLLPSLTNWSSRTASWSATSPPRGWSAPATPCLCSSML